MLIDRGNVENLCLGRVVVVVLQFPFAAWLGDLKLVKMLRSSKHMQLALAVIQSAVEVGIFIHYCIFCATGNAALLLKGILQTKAEATEPS